MAGPPDETEYRRWREEADRTYQAARVQAEAGIHNWVRLRRGA